MMRSTPPQLPSFYFLVISGMAEAWNATTDKEWRTLRHTNFLQQAALLSHGFQHRTLSQTIELSRQRSTKELGSTCVWLLSSCHVKEIVFFSFCLFANSLRFWGCALSAKSHLPGELGGINHQSPSAEKWAVLGCSSPGFTEPCIPTHCRMPGRQCKRGVTGAEQAGSGQQFMTCHTWKQAWGNRGGMKAELRSANIFEGKKKKKDTWLLLPCIFSCAFCLLELGQSMLSNFSDH